MLTKVNKNTFKLDGSIFNADKLIDNLLTSKKDEENSKIFRDDFDLILNLKEVYLDDQNIIRDFKGKLISIRFPCDFQLFRAVLSIPMSIILCYPRLP